MFWIWHWRVLDMNDPLSDWADQERADLMRAKRIYPFASIREQTVKYTKSSVTPWFLYFISVDRWLNYKKDFSGYKTVYTWTSSNQKFTSKHCVGKMYFKYFCWVISKIRWQNSQWWVFWESDVLAANISVSHLIHNWLSSRAYLVGLFILKSHFYKKFFIKKYGSKL